MSRERYVALGLARARAPWFTEVARWSTSSALPLEFVKCLSVEEARARLSSGRAFSALIADGTLPEVDRDLLDLAQGQGCAVLVVDDARVARDWMGLGASALLPDDFDRDQLLAALATHCTAVADASRTPSADATFVEAWRGSLIAVAGAGGAGTSTIAMAAAQGLADDTRNRGTVLLADLALHADQAMLHHIGEVVPGLPELVDAHRGGVPSADELARLTFEVPDRHYRLLLGLRRHRDWATLRPRSLDAAIDSLRRANRLVIADVDADIEGEQECGSIEVEERNILARSTMARADVVVVVGRHGLSGLHRLVRLVGDILDFGVPADRVLPVVNRAPRSPRAHAETTRALAELVGRARPEAAQLANPIFLPERRRLDSMQHDAARLPAELTRPVASALTAFLDRVGNRTDAVGEPEPVAAGSLGSWGSDAEVGR